MAKFYWEKDGWLVGIGESSKTTIQVSENIHATKKEAGQVDGGCDCNKIDNTVRNSSTRRGNVSQSDRVRQSKSLEKSAPYVRGTKMRFFVQNPDV
jgi:hypothetical protein